MTTTNIDVKNPNLCVVCKTDPSFIRHPVVPNKGMEWVMWWKCWECGFESHGTDDYWESVKIWDTNNNEAEYEASKLEWERQHKEAV